VGVGTGAAGGLNGRDFGGLATLAPDVALSPGQLGGYVLDRTGAAVSNAGIEIRNLGTGSSFSVGSTPEGYWIAFGLASGTYQITVSHPGFRMLQQNISYDAGNPNSYRLTLDVGATTQSIEISADSTTLSAKEIENLPRAKKQKAAAAAAPPPSASANVFNLQQRVAGVLPVAVDVPRTGTSYRFVRPLVVNEETKLTFTYKTK